MSKTAKLTSTQRAVLSHSINQTGGRIERFPAGVTGQAKANVLASLKLLGLARSTRAGWVVTKAAFGALGLDATAPKAVPQVKPGTKQAKLIALLDRAQGASMEQMQKATDWQRHTLRGVITEVLRQRLGLTVVCEDDGNGTKVYRIVR